MTDIVGKKFGRLKVISLDHYNKFKNPYWLCECECGKSEKQLTNQFVENVGKIN